MGVKLTRIRLQDAQAFSRCINDQEIVLKTYDEAFTLPFSEKDGVEYIRKCRKDKENPEFSIVQDGQFVGTISLDRSEDNPNAYEIGYFVDREHWGKGIASQAVSKVLEYGFKKLKAEKILGEVFEDNPASARVLMKAGFDFSHKTAPKKAGQAMNIHYQISRERFRKGQSC